MEKKEDESNIQYMERMLAALKTNLEIRGAVIVVKTLAGNGVMASSGEAPILSLYEGEWD